MAVLVNGDAEGYWRPCDPCDSCRVQQLDCIVHPSQGVSCYPCVILSRQCRVFPAPETPSDMLSASYGEQIQGDSEAALGRVSSQPMLPTRFPSAPKSRFRLSSAQAEILEDWARMNEEHPYPTESEKLVLQQHTSLSRTQVCNWFTNYRRKRKAALQKEHGSQLTTNCQGVQPIQVSTQLWESLDPLERWRQSPPEAEPAALGDISTALRTAGTWHSSVGSDGASSVQRRYVGSNPDTAPLWTLDLDNRVPSVASANSLESRLSAESCSSYRSSHSIRSPGFTTLQTKEQAKEATQRLRLD